MPEPSAKSQAAKFAKEKKRIGFEFGADHIKVLYLEHMKDKDDVLYLDVISTKNMMPDKIAEELKTKLKPYKTKQTERFLVVPISSSIIRTIQIPSLNEKEIRDILDLQAGRQTPYSREELIIDFLNLGEFQNVYTKVLVVMVTRELVKKQLAALDMAALKTTQIVFSGDGIGVFCASKMKDSLQENKTCAVLSIDLDSSDMNICGSGGLLFTRNITIGMNNLASDKDAAVSRLTDEVKKTLEAYQAEDIAAAPQALYIGKNGRVDNSLYDSLQKTLSIEVKDIALSSSVSTKHPYDEKIESNKTPSFFPLIACLGGVSNLRIALIPDDVILQKKFEEKARKIITAGILFMLIFFQVCLILISKMYNKERMLGSLKERYKEKIGEADKLANMSEKTTMVRNFLANRNDVVNILVRLSEILPDDIYLKGITLDKDGKIFIKGTSKTMSRIFTFVKELEIDPLFAGVKTESTESKKQEGEDVSDFGITMEMERQE